MKALSLLFRGLVPALAVVLLASCAHDDDFEKRFGADAPREKTIAVKTSGKITLDGNLNEGAWAKAPAYAFQPPARNYGVVMPKVAKNQDAFEPGMANWFMMTNIFISALCSRIPMWFSMARKIRRISTFREIFSRFSSNPKSLRNTGNFMRLRTARRPLSSLNPAVMPVPTGARLIRPF